MCVPEGQFDTSFCFLNSQFNNAIYYRSYVIVVWQRKYGTRAALRP